MSVPCIETNLGNGIRPPDIVGELAHTSEMWTKAEIYVRTVMESQFIILWSGDKAPREFAHLRVALVSQACLLATVHDLEHM